jgi:hypothetical protein
MTHSLPDKVEAAYRRGDLLEKRIKISLGSLSPLEYRHSLGIMA